VNPSPPNPNHLNPTAFPSGIQGRLFHLIRLNSVLSSNRYNPVLIQETTLSNSTNFKVPDYSVFRADRALTHRGSSTTVGNQNDEGVLTLINSDHSFQAVPHPRILRPSLRLSLCQNEVQEALPSPLNVYSPPIRNTQLDSRPTHPTWDSHTSPDSAGNYLFNWI